MLASTNIKVFKDLYLLDGFNLYLDMLDTGPKFDPIQAPALENLVVPDEGNAEGSCLTLLKIMLKELGC